jgi:hypothetical protein
VKVKLGVAVPVRTGPRTRDRSKGRDKGKVRYTNFLFAPLLINC